jgi:tetratricopeptide (TPR) repeat protein
MPRTSDCIISKASSLYASGFSDEAVQLLADTFAAGKSETAVLTRLGELLVDSGRHERALEFLEEDGSHIDAAPVLLLRGICHEALGDLDTARNIVKNLLESERLHAETLALKGKLALRGCHWEDAEKLSNKAIASATPAAETHGMDLPACSFNATICRCILNA